MNINLKVLDISHHNSVDPDGFAKMHDFGVRGIIHKATQGNSYIDPSYARQRQMATDAGLLWGAYHFATGDDVDAQVDHFISVAAPDENTLMALDHEPNGGNQLDLDGAQAFLESARDKLNRKLVLYSGNLIKEQLTGANDFFAGHRLWLAQYGPAPHLPAAWSSIWLWQFSDGTINKQGLQVPGISGQVDMNSYGGGDDSLAAEWAS